MPKEVSNLHVYMLRVSVRPIYFECSRPLQGWILRQIYQISRDLPSQYDAQVSMFCLVPSVHFIFYSYLLRKDFINVCPSM